MNPSSPHQSTHLIRRRLLIFGLPAVAILAAAATAVGVTLANSGADNASAGTLGDATHMGLVEIKTAKMDSLQEFYVDAVGLSVLDEDTSTVTLGSGNEPLIQLSSTDASSLSSPRDAGLYHSAVLFSTEAELAQALLRVSKHAPESFQGSADHAVSQAFYFGDPDGNGVELYVDRPRNEWVWNGDQVDMTTVALDVNQFISRHAPQNENDAPDSETSDAVMGHVHLKVGDLPQAEAFYAGVLGFDVTSRVDGAVFYSAGGYHHHLATNTWNSESAGKRPNTAGLGKLTIVLESAEELDAVAARLAAANIAATITKHSLITEDPWGSVIELTLP